MVTTTTGDGASGAPVPGSLWGPLPGGIIVASRRSCRDRSRLWDGISMIRDAQRKDKELARFRDYLRLLARSQLDHRFRRQIDPSDIVQATLLKALESIDEVRAKSDAEMAAWLRSILAHHLLNAMRGLHCQCRDIRRERSLEQALEQSSIRLEKILGTMKTCPSANAEHHELLGRLAKAMDGLPAPQREALLLHHWQGKPLEKVGIEMGRTKDSVAGLIRRGLERLREDLKDMK